MTSLSKKLNNNILIKRNIKGLNSYYINQNIKTKIDFELLKYLNNTSLQIETFKCKLLASEKKQIKSIFRKYDKNNFWLSVVLFDMKDESKLQEDKFLLFLLVKLLGFSYIENKRISQIIDNIIYKLNIKKNSISNENWDVKISKNDIFKLNEVRKIVISIAQKYNLKTLLDITNDLVLYNFIEFHKNQFYFKGSKKTIFGQISKNKIEKYVSKRNAIEKRMNREIINIPDQQLFEKQIKNNEVIFKYYLKTQKNIRNYLISQGYKIHEYSFVTEQTQKPYFSDKPKLNLNEKMELVLSYSLLLVWSFIVALPISQVFYHAFNGMSDTVLSVKGFKFSLFNFKYLINETQFLTWFKNTIIISVAVTIINIFGASLLAYALSRFRFKGRKSTFIILIILNMLPSIAGLTSFIVLNRLLQEAVNASPYIIIGSVYAGTNLLGFSFVIKNYLDTISKEIDEAAKIDGASNIKTFTKIILPVIAPILGVIAIQSFIIPFVDIMLPKFFLSNRDQYTLPLGLSFLITNPQLSAVHYGAYTAGALIVAVPMTIVYFIADLFMKQNKLKGAVKG